MKSPSKTSVYNSKLPRVLNEAQRRTSRSMRSTGDGYRILDPEHGVLNGCAQWNRNSPGSRDQASSVSDEFLILPIKRMVLWCDLINDIDRSENEQAGGIRLAVTV